VDTAAIGALVKKHRRRPLAVAADFPEKVRYGRDLIERLIPHRPPFLLVDTIDGLDIERGRIMGTRSIVADDPVFAGHFPGSPVYPASLQLEMAGQMGLCLHSFLKQGSTAPPPAPCFENVRVSRVLHALFQAPLVPPVVATLLAQSVRRDEFGGTVVLQVLSGSIVCSISALDVVFL